MVAALLVAIVQPTLSQGQLPEGLEVAAESTIRTPGEELTVFVMTMGAGSFVWERFGHNAIWIHDEARGTDVAYNWGLFSFEQENFLLRFIQGRMDYWMDGFDAEATATSYIRADRSVWVQELNLTPAQRVELRDALARNALPENRFYRYDYFRDNCSTRVRDAIDAVLGGQLRALTEPVPAGSTYRDHARSATGGTPVLYTGIMLALGNPTDRELSVWEEMFLPLNLRERIRDLTIETPTGERQPLVRSEREIYLSAAFPPGAGTGPGIWPYLVLGVLFAAGVMVSARFSDRRRDARAGLRLLALAWGLTAGILGTVVMGLWLLTDHTAAYANENLFFYNPLLIVLGILLALAAGVGSRRRRAALLVGAVVGGLSVLGLLLKVLPGLDQENAELIALALPVNLAFLYAAWELHRRAGLVAAREAVPATGDELVPNPA